MDKYTEKVLRKRAKDSECIICGEKINLDKDEGVICVRHFILDNCVIHERHIKQSGNDN